MAKRSAASTGALLLILGCTWTLFFSTTTALFTCFSAFFLVGIGMGFVTLSTLLSVQDSLEAIDLGVATSSHQFFRTLGGTVGVGICGGLITGRMNHGLAQISAAAASGEIPAETADKLSRNLETLFQPDVLTGLPEKVNALLQQAISRGTIAVFTAVVAAAVLCLICCILVPADK
jgi:hypothetical protein